MAVLAAAAPFLAAAGSAVSAIGAISAGNAQKQAYDYNAQVEANNAANARAAAASQETDQAYKTSRLLGTQKAAAGAAGVDPGTGSPLQIMTDTAARGTLDALRLKYQGDVTATADLNQGALDTYEGQQAQTASYLRAAGTVLNGASMYGTKYAGTSPF